jgi:glycine cleavage system H protein
VSAEETYPPDLLYHPEHDWVRIDGDVATFGVTWFAQNALGEIVFWDGPAVGSTVTKDQPYAELESVKAVSDVVAPLSGEVIEANDALSGEPGEVNESPYDAGWLVRVRLADPAEAAALLDADAYRLLVQQ